LLGILLTVIVLGVMVAIMFTTLGGSPSSTGSTTTIPGVTVTTAPKTPASGADEAAIAACQANFQAIETALADYRALNGSLPAAGTKWATATSHGGPFMQAWPENPIYYAITWDGAQLNVSPARGATSHGTAGTSSPKTGCFAA
jgi:hypothetical protein